MGYVAMTPLTLSGSPGYNPYGLSGTWRDDTCCTQPYTILFIHLQPRHERSVKLYQLSRPMPRHGKTRRSVHRKRRQTRGRKQRGGIFVKLVCQIVNGVRKCFRGSSTVNNNNNSAARHAAFVANIERKLQTVDEEGVYSGELLPNNLPFGHVTPDGYVVHTREEAKIDSIAKKTIETLKRYLTPDETGGDSTPIRGMFKSKVSPNSRQRMFTIIDESTHKLHMFGSTYENDKFIYKVLE